MNVMKEKDDAWITKHFSPFYLLILKSVEV